MTPNDYWNIFLGLVAGALLLPFGLLAERFLNSALLRIKLGLVGNVFPAKSFDGEIPLVHLRTSFDEIVFGTNPPTLRGYTHSGDVEAAMKIFQLFNALPVEIEFDYFPEIRADMKNVIIVGASSRSDVSRELGQELYELGVRVHGKNEHAHFCDASGQTYRCEHKLHNDQMIVTKDAGVIFRKITDTGATVLLCAGLHTFGSQAAAEVALSDDFQRKIRKLRLTQFIQFVTVDVNSSGPRAGLGLIRQSIRWKDLPLQKVVNPP